MEQLALRVEALLEAMESHVEAAPAQDDLLFLVHRAQQLLHDEVYPTLDDLDGARRALLRQQRSAPATFASFTHSDFAALSHMKV